MSDWIINAHGFVPVPIIITEPALGGFGGGLVPVFIQPNKPVERDGKMYPVPPDVTAVAGVYTLNDSWFAGGGRFGSISKYGLRYKVFGGYGDINLSYYHDFDKLGTEEFKFNIEAVPVYVYLGKQLPDPRFVVGIDYLYIKSELTPKNNKSLIPGSWDKAYDAQVSMLGAVAEFDSRDNSFTPNRGIKTYLDFKWSSQAFGSDYNYEELEGAFYWYIPVINRWVSGLRLDMQQVFGKAPFFIKPFIDMRGIPAARYQGNTTALVELEERFDFGDTKRWSAVVFGGAGKGFDEYDEFSDAEWAYSYGIGARYLLARKLNLRAGVDIAMGPEGFTYYIIFGTGWMRQ